MRNMISCFRPNKDAEKKAEDMVIRNGGLLLKKLIAFNNGRGYSTRTFSLNEIKNATNKYEPDQIILRRGPYILYKGFLQDCRVIVKECMAEKFLEDYISDIVFSSQLITHKNVLKLLGCCLESSIPILIFEFPEKGSLDDYIYKKNSRPDSRALSWKIRLKIAVDVANVIAYLHTGFSRPIIHRGIQTKIIFLDEDYGAKVSDFTFSIAIPQGETHIIDAVFKETCGYLPPEYAKERKFNEKFDVYSFGIVLLVLLTGKSRYDRFSNAKDQYCGLVDGIKQLLENERFEEIFDPIIVEEEPWPGKEQQLKAFLTLALGCARADPEDRPEITDVGKQLRQMYQSLVSNCVINIS